MEERIVVRKKNKIEVSMGAYDEYGFVIQIVEDIGEDTLEIIDLVSPADARAVAYRLIQLADQWERDDFRPVLDAVPEEASEGRCKEGMGETDGGTD